jgi:hypothetical protein
MAYIPSNPNGQATMANSAPVVIASNQSGVPVTDNGTTLSIDDGAGSITVDGTVAATQSGTWNITNISGTVSLPTGAATSANQTTQITALQLLDNVVNTAGSSAVTSLYQVGGTDGTLARILSTNASGHLNIADGGNSITVDGTVAATQSGAWNITNITGTVSLPTGAATETTLSALNTKVPANLTVTATRLLVDGSGVTQPVSGTVTIQDGGNTITVDGTVAATQSGTWSVRTQDGAGNAVTSRASGASRPFDVAIVDGSGNQITTFGGGTEYADGTTVATPTGSAILGWDGTAVQVIRTDASGVMAIQDNGGSITIDGTVTANAGTGTFNTSDANAVSQSTATAAQKGYLSLAGVTATLPTYTAGNTNAMTMTTTGLLRVDGSNVTQPVSGTVTADTELPTAAALADAAANPTTPTVGAANLGFNGTTWDRLKSEGTNADGEAVGTAGSLSVCSHGEVYNGTAWDRMRAASALDGTGATSHTGILGVLQPGKRFDPANLGTAVSSTSSVDVNGSNSITLAIETTTTGTYVIEATGDGINWGNPEVFDAGADIWVSGTSLTPTLGKVYQILCGGYRAVRIRTTATLGATVAHAFNATMSQAFLGGIDTGAAPHNFGYTTFHKDGEYSTTQTGAALWTPTSGKKFAVTDFTISTGGTTSGIVTLWQGASGDTAYTTGTDPALFRGEFAPSATAKPGIAKVLTVPFVSTTADHILRVTTSAAMTIYVQVNGYEI